MTYVARSEKLKRPREKKKREKKKKKTFLIMKTLGHRLDPQPPKKEREKRKNKTFESGEFGCILYLDAGLG